MTDPEEIVKAEDIEECDSCPLFGNDCPGGWTSGGGGVPIEPPCASWNGDEEIYEGMYSQRRDYSEQELRWWRIDQKQKEREEAENKRKKEIEDAKKAVFSISKYGNAKTRYSEWNDGFEWWCVECHRWVHPWSLSMFNGIASTHCPRCGAGLAHSYLLEEEK